MDFKYNQKIEIPNTKSTGGTTIDDVRGVMKKVNKDCLYFKEKVLHKGVTEYHFKTNEGRSNGAVFYFLKRDLVSNDVGW